MPISLPPLTRRSFLGTLAAGLGALSTRSVWAGDKFGDPNRFFLLSDIHIDKDPAKINRTVNMSNNLKAVVAELLAETNPAGNVIINGDCAHNTGEEGDYANLLELLKPVREKGFPVHMNMGNHDRRDHFWAAFDITGEKRGAVEGRQITLLKAPHANVFMLDSLDKTNSTPGRIGEEQMAWLDKALKKHDEKPAVVIVHHQPDVREKISGLLDTQEFKRTLADHKNVKALIYGHTHDWNFEKKDNLYCVNLPPVAYIFKEGKPNGWVDLQLEEKGAKLQLRALDKKHELNNQEVKMEW